MFSVFLSEIAKKSGLRLNCKSRVFAFLRSYVLNMYTFLQYFTASFFPFFVSKITSLNINTDMHIFGEGMAIFDPLIIPNDTIVCLNGFLWSSPSACLPFCLRPLLSRAVNKMKGKRDVSLYLIAPRQAAAVNCTNSRFCLRATFRNPLASGVGSRKGAWAIPWVG